MNTKSNLERKKYVSIPVCEKLKALKELKNGVPISMVAKNLQVRSATVRSWMSKETKLNKWTDDHCAELLKNKKRMRESDNKIVDQATWMWFEQRRAAGIPTPGVIIRRQAKTFHKAFRGNDTFEASNGWLHKWQKRYNIHKIGICGEKLSADHDAANKFKEEFIEYIENEDLTTEQIFNADEIAIDYKLLPKSNFSSKVDSGVFSVKCKKERLTVMACSNASGILKLPLVVIGRFSKPRAIKNLRSLPVYYRAQKSAWLTANLFEEWFNDEFVPRVTTFLQSQNLAPKAVLYIDNCVTHPVTLSKNGIVVRFFPSNTSPLIQPMCQNCLQTVKMDYRRQLMAHLLTHIKREETLEVALKKISIRDVIFWLDDAWKNVSMMTIEKSWNELSLYGDTATNPSNDDEDSSLMSLTQSFCDELQGLKQFEDINNYDINSWLKSSTLSPEECLSDGEIIQILKENETRLHV